MSVIPSDGSGVIFLMWSLMCKSTLLVNAEYRHRSTLNFSNHKHSSVLIRKGERTTKGCKDILPIDTTLVHVCVLFEVFKSTDRQRLYDDYVGSG